MNQFLQFFSFQNPHFIATKLAHYMKQEQGKEKKNHCEVDGCGGEMGCCDFF